MAAFLLDSHVFVWSQVAPQNIGHAAAEALADGANTVAVSIASLWELWIKRHGRGLPEFEVLLDRGADAMTALIADAGFSLLDITPSHAEAAARLPRLHADPFDRMLIAQAMVSRLTLITHDDVFDRYSGVALLKT